MRINFVFPMVWPTAVCRTLHAFSNECYYKACQVKKICAVYPTYLQRFYHYFNIITECKTAVFFLFSFCLFFLSFFRFFP